MHSRFSYLALFSAAALAFSGCEWGGAHEDTWNDGYSWANFTGTYRFVKAVVYAASSSSTDSTSESTSEAKTVELSGSSNGRMDSDTQGSGQITKLGTGIVPGTFKAKVGNVTIQDNGSGTLTIGGSTISSSIDYANGGWSFTSSKVNAKAGDNIGVTYKYYSTAGGGGGGGGSGSEGTSTTLSFLKVTQQGNTFTMTGDNGITYTGKITGSNVDRDNYAAARTVYISFDVASANGMKITGNFSGVWSGASEKSYGVLSDRQIHGTHSRAGNFVGVAADTTITVPTISVSE